MAIALSLCGALPATAAPVAMELRHWKTGFATAVARCGGGIAAVHENDDSIAFGDTAKPRTVALRAGARPRDIIAGGAGTCLVLEGGRSVIAVERARQVVAEISLHNPLGGSYSLAHSSFAFDGSSIFVTVPQVQAIIRIGAAGEQQIVGTAFGDEPQNPKGWLFHSPTPPQSTPEERLAPDLVAIPPFPQVGSIAVAPDKAVWVIRYGGDPLHTELLRYSEDMHGFSIYPLEQIGIGSLEPTNLVFAQDGWVAFASQTSLGLRSVTISPFGEHESRVVASGADPSRIGLSDRSSAYDARKRMWIVDPDHRQLLLQAARVSCVAGPWKDPVSVFDLTDDLFGILDATSGTLYFVRPATTSGTACRERAARRDHRVRGIVRNQLTLGELGGSPA